MYRYCAFPDNKWKFCTGKVFYIKNVLLSADFLTWTASITTAPDPPSNLNIEVQGGKLAVVSWEPPNIGKINGYF